MSTGKLKNVIEVLERLKKATNCSTDAALARYLGVGSSRIPMWKKREMVDLLLISQKCEGVNTGWLLTGEGEMFSSEEHSDPQCTHKNGPETPNKQPISAILSEDQARYAFPPDNITKAMGKAMCKHGIQEGDLLILDTNKKARPGDLVITTQNGYPETTRWTAADPPPYAIIQRLIRNCRQPEKPDLNSAN